MKVIARLFQARRWMLWLPVPISFAIAGTDLTALPAPLVGGLIFWIPYWLAWWLSNGFSTVRRGVPGRGMPVAGSGGSEIYFNYADGHYQNNPGPSSYRI